MAQPLDTNVIIRYLTNDNPEQSPRAYRLFQQLAAGSAAARVTEGVLVETVQVLSSRQLYDLPRPDIQRHLRNIISFRGVQLPGKRRYLRALDLYAATPALSFVDALLAVLAQDVAHSAVTSCDTGFDRVSGLMPVES